MVDSFCYWCRGQKFEKSQGIADYITTTPSPPPQYSTGLCFVNPGELKVKADLSRI